MQHRHLDLPDGTYSVAAVHSVLERGGASDIYALLATMRADPFGPAATAVERAIATSEVYGYPRLLYLCLQRFRDESRARQAAPATGDPAR